MLLHVSQNDDTSNELAVRDSSDYGTNPELEDWQMEDDKVHFEKQSEALSGQEIPAYLQNVGLLESAIRFESANPPSTSYTREDL